MIIDMIKPWFQSKLAKKSSNNDESPTKLNKPSLEELDICKQKILSVTPYSYYFIELVYQQVLDMSSFYCKLGDEDFLLLLNMFNTITANLELQENTPASLLAI